MCEVSGRIVIQVSKVGTGVCVCVIGYRWYLRHPGFMGGKSNVCEVSGI